MYIGIRVPYLLHKNIGSCLHGGLIGNLFVPPHRKPLKQCVAIVFSSRQRVQPIYTFLFLKCRPPRMNHRVDRIDFQCVPLSAVLV